MTDIIISSLNSQVADKKGSDSLNLTCQANSRYFPTAKSTLRSVLDKQILKAILNSLMASCLQRGINQRFLWEQ